MHEENKVFHKKPSNDSRYDMHQDKAGEFRFAIKAFNGDVVGQSWGGYTTESGCRKALYQ